MAKQNMQLSDSDVIKLFEYKMQKTSKYLYIENNDKISTESHNQSLTAARIKKTQGTMK